MGGGGYLIMVHQPTIELVLAMPDSRTLECGGLPPLSRRALLQCRTTFRTTQFSLHSSHSAATCSSVQQKRPGEGAVVHSQFGSRPARSLLTGQEQSASLQLRFFFHEPRVTNHGSLSSLRRPWVAGRWSPVTLSLLSRRTCTSGSLSPSKPPASLGKRLRQAVACSPS